jgi:hypothetical protein
MRPTPLIDRIILHLVKRPSCTSQEIADALGKPLANVQIALSYLRHYGRVAVTGHKSVLVRRNVKIWSASPGEPKTRPRAAPGTTERIGHYRYPVERVSGRHGGLGAEGRSVKRRSTAPTSADQALIEANVGPSGVKEPH